MATNIFWCILEISTDHPPSEVHKPYRTVYRPLWIVTLVESSQQNMATQKYRMNTSCLKAQLENWSSFICRYWRKLVWPLKYLMTIGDVLWDWSWALLQIYIQGGSNYNTPSDKMQFLYSRVRFFIPKFLGLYERDPATILKLKKNILVFSSEWVCSFLTAHQHKKAI